MSLIYSYDHRINVKTSEIICFDDCDDDVLILRCDTGGRPANASYDICIYEFILFTWETFYSGTLTNVDQ